MVGNNAEQVVGTPARTRGARQQNAQRRRTAQRTRHSLDRKVHVQRARSRNAGSSSLSTSGLLTVAMAPLLQMRRLNVQLEATKRHAHRKNLFTAF